MAGEMNRKIVLEDGAEFPGWSFGAVCDRVCELVFNTSMVGYQEIVTDPSYAGQMVVMTYPLMGNYGMTDEDDETKVPVLGGMVARDYCDSPSNFRCTKSLGEALEEHQIPGIYGVDTRRIARSIRDLGSRKALICDISMPKARAMEILRRTQLPHDQVAQVSCKKPWYARTANPWYHVVAVDCGIKLNIVRSLKARGCNVTVVPWDTSAEFIAGLHPDGILISNGPGNPEDAMPTIAAVRALRGKYTIFGICLGHQIIGLAYGATTWKMKFGHRGGNHPVKDLTTGRIEITAQNHSYAVSEASVAGTGLEITHINLLDHTVEGMQCSADRVFSVQYHPESAPGPQDSGYLFDRFLAAMKEAKVHAKA